MASDPYLGEIKLFAGNFAPFGWALCNGQLMSISQNVALFSILGTTYGGDGVQTFGLPDMRGHAPIHWGQGAGLSPFVIGQSGGTENQTVLVGNMPAHSHTIKADGDATNTTTTVSGAYLDGKTASGEPVASTGNAATLNPATIGQTGGSQPFSNREPYLAVTYIIALQGIFPSRN